MVKYSQISILFYQLCSILKRQMKDFRFQIIKTYLRQRRIWKRCKSCFHSLFITTGRSLDFQNQVLLYLAVGVNHYCQITLHWTLQYFTWRNHKNCNSLQSWSIFISHGNKFLPLLHVNFGSVEDQGVPCLG